MKELPVDLAAMDVSDLAKERAVRDEVLTPLFQRWPALNRVELREQVLALTIADRESILRALDDPPGDGLAELRGVLLAEHEWRMREGLV